MVQATLQKAQAQLRAPAARLLQALRALRQAPLQLRQAPLQLRHSLMQCSKARWQLAVMLLLPAQQVKTTAARWGPARRGGLPPLIMLPYLLTCLQQVGMIQLPACQAMAPLRVAACPVVQMQS